MHNDQSSPAITERDFDMINGAIELKLRAPTARYMLRRWSIDCLQDHGLYCSEYRFSLNNSLAIYGTKNVMLATDYCSPDKQEQVRSIT